MNRRHDQFNAYVIDTLDDELYNILIYALELCEMRGIPYDMMDLITCHKHFPFYNFMKHPWVRDSRILEDYIGNISSVNHLQLEWIIDYPDKQWDFTALSDPQYYHNWNISWVETFPSKPWDFSLISKYDDLTQEFIEKYIDRGWDFAELSKSECMTFDFVEKYIDYGWDFYILSTDPSLTLEFVKKHMNKDWYWNKIIIRFDIDLEFIIDVVKESKFISFSNLHTHPNFKLEWVYHYSFENWDWGALTFIIGKDFIQQFPNKSWDKKYLIQNNILTEIMTENYKEYIDYPIKHNLNIYNYINSIEYYEKYVTNEKDLNDISCKVPLEIVLKYPDRPWDWGRKGLSCNPNLTLEFIKKFREKPWCISYSNGYYDDSIKELNQNDVCKYNYKVNSSGIYNYYNKDTLLLYSGLSFHKNFSIDWVKELPEFGGDWVLDNSKQHITYWHNSNDHLKYFMINNIIVHQSHFNISWIKMFPDRDWDFEELTDNSNLDMSWIEQYPFENWSFKKLSYNRTLTPEFIAKFIHRDWDFNILSSHRDISLDLVERYIKNWNWGVNGLSCSNHIHLDFIMKYQDKLWDWSTLTNSKHFDIYWVRVLPNKPWDFSVISKMNTFTVEWIKEFPDALWDWEYLFTSGFSYDLHLKFTKLLREYILAYRIQCWWRKIFYDPCSSVRIKIMNREFDEYNK